jgi:hypothetical protein
MKRLVLEDLRFEQDADHAAVMRNEAGRDADLAGAEEVCATALECRMDSTDPAWLVLAIRQRQIRGLIERRRFRPSGQTDIDGNPIPVRRHRAANPRRSRPPRFLRLSPPNAPAD